MSGRQTVAIIRVASVDSPSTRMTSLTESGICSRTQGKLRASFFAGMTRLTPGGSSVCGAAAAAGRCLVVAAGPFPDVAAGRCPVVAAGPLPGVAAGPFPVVAAGLPGTAEANDWQADVVACTDLAV